MNKIKSELYVITATKRLVDYISLINENTPKKYRYSIINKIDKSCLELIECLYLANMYDLKNPKRKEKQEEAKVRLNLIEYIFHFGVKRQCYTSHQFEVMTKQLSDCNSYLEKWILSDSNRINN